jgi:hypothetical protein
LGVVDSEAQYRRWIHQADDHRSSCKITQLQIHYRDR